MSSLLARRLAVARGDEPADLVVRGGHVFSAFTREWLDADVAVVDGYVAGVGADYDAHETMLAHDRYVVPGFIDAHLHLESPKLFVDEFARLVLPLGTTAVVADPHEIANALGEAGVHWFVDACSELPLDVYFMASSCVPASPFESPREVFGPAELESLLRRRRMLGVAEMMNFPGVVAGEGSELAKLGLGEHVDGHAPGLLGKALQAYAAARIYSDHEALTPDEARERLRAGMWVLIREATMARNLHALLPVVRELGPWRCAFCTDDKDPDDIADAGHINGMVREAVAFGIPPEDALLMASLHPAQWHGLHELGAIAPGYRADLLLLPDLESFQPEIVLKAGRAVGAIRRPEIPQWVRESVNVRPPATGDFRIPFGGEAARVIGLVPDQVVTEHLVEQPTVREGEAVADPERDHAKIAVLERHHASGRIGLGLVKGFGLRAGALASTVGHDAHNLCVVGMSDADMVAAVERLAALGGGIVVVEAGEVRAELPLPIGGLLSDLPLDEVIARTRACADAAAALGCRLETPFLTMSFLPLSVIPSLKITDRGLVDVDAFELVPLEA